MINVSIIGANGYSGLELINILSNHPNVRLARLVSRSNEGELVCSLFPSLSHLGNLKYSGLNMEDIIASSNVVFTALPHAASAEICAKLIENGVRVIDLSADFRYKSLETYQNTYKVTHPAPSLLQQAVYGLPELFREQIRSAQLIGNPGCYTTSAILPLYPLLKERVIDPNGIVVNSASGTSGAGRKADLDLNISEVYGNYKAYALTTHRHTSEIEEVLSQAGKPVTLTFTPHLLPIKRGILSTIYANTTASEQDIASIYSQYYGTERFISLQTLPEIKHVVYSNNCNIGFKIDKRTNKLIILSALDNLVKGASGQAVQNLNIMYNLAEDTGLGFVARYI